MKLYLVSIRDAAVGQYKPAVAVQSTGGFLRGLADEVNRQDQNNDLYKHAEDFEAFLVGQFDDETGVVTSVVPVSIGTCKSMVRGVQ